MVLSVVGVPERSVVDSIVVGLLVGVVIILVVWVDNSVLVEADCVIVGATVVVVSPHACKSLDVGRAQLVQT